VLEEKRDRQAALDLELAVESAPRPLEDLARDVGRDDLDRPAEKARKTAAASRNRMSTAGRQKLTAGPSSTRSTTLWSLSRTSPRWRPPGAM
jgi:hypothetical protein